MGGSREKRRRHTVQDSGSSEEESESDEVTGFIDDEASEEDSDAMSDNDSRFSGESDTQEYFPNFGKLPPELRIRIWQFFCPDLQSRSFMFQFMAVTSFEKTEIWEHWTLERQTAAIRALLAVHGETRALALRRFPDPILIRNGTGLVRFNKNIDVVHLKINKKWRVRDLPEDFCEHVRQLATGRILFDPEGTGPGRIYTNEDISPNTFLRVFTFFPNLRTWFRCVDGKRHREGTLEWLNAEEHRGDRLATRVANLPWNANEAAYDVGPWAANNEAEVLTQAEVDKIAAVETWPMVFLIITFWGGGAGVGAHDVYESSGIDDASELDESEADSVERMMDELDEEEAQSSVRRPPPRRRLGRGPLMGVDSEEDEEEEEEEGGGARFSSLEASDGEGRGVAPAPRGQRRRVVDSDDEEDDEGQREEEPVRARRSRSPRKHVVLSDSEYEDDSRREVPKEAIVISDSEDEETSKAAPVAAKRRGRTLVQDSDEDEDEDEDEDDAKPSGRRARKAAARRALESSDRGSEDEEEESEEEESSEEEDSEEDEGPENQYRLLRDEDEDDANSSENSYGRGEEDDDDEDERNPFLDGLAEESEDEEDD
ncbi:unnamed protein product [Parascedosporium putredinis]|uniref:2EXR domain-containing protein n=1 Tax=Parascedosporium putredinis TaxID=1442378 RepID=A0A9P1MA58_9PEZI|nr:unnamed protein product [Parascedosporium putredinis]CAI7993446.1 unnamed protein product [Parascedosporium putredinis]